MTTAQPPVEIRRYANAAAFQADAANMAAAGWLVQAQSSTKAGQGSRALIFAIIGIVVGILLLGIVGAVVFGIVGGLIGAAGGGEVYTVTYRPSLPPAYDPRDHGPTGPPDMADRLMMDR